MCHFFYHKNINRLAGNLINRGIFNALISFETGSLPPLSITLSAPSNICIRKLIPFPWRQTNLSCATHVYDGSMLRMGYWAGSFQPFVYSSLDPIVRRLINTTAGFR